MTLRSMAFLLAGLLVVGVSPSSAEAVSTVAELSNARVPAMCGHRAGRLVNGEYPGLALDESMYLDAGLSRIGDLRGGRSKEALALIHCVHGPSSYSDFLVLYSATLEPLQKWSVGKFGGGSSYVTGSVISHGVARVEVSGVQQDGEALCCGSADVLMKLKWSSDRHKMVARSKKVTEQRTLRRLVDAANQDNSNSALDLADPYVVSTFDAYRESGTSSFEAGACYAPYDTSIVARNCLVYGTHVDFSIGFQHLGFMRWRALTIDVLPRD